MKFSNPSVCAAIYRRDTNPPLEEGMDIKMNNAGIIGLPWEGDKAAIKELKSKYDKHLMKIALNILANYEDGEESVNDTYLRAWHSMSVRNPNELSTYLGKITREISIDIFKKRSERKNQVSQFALALLEIEECIPSGSAPDWETEPEVLDELINSYLNTIPKEVRTVFLSRYFFMDSIKDIAGSQRMSRANVENVLHRARIGLKDYLEKGGF